MPDGPRAAAGDLVVETPEGVRFSFLLAGPVVRALAFAVDFFAIALVASAVSILTRFLAVVSEDVAGAVLVLVHFALSIGYGIVCEASLGGRTLGKRLFGLRVLDAAGLRLSLRQVVLRNLLRFVDALPAFYLLGAVSALVTRRAQRVGDLVAGTVVVRTREALPPDLDQVAPGRHNSLRSAPHLVARLRKRVAPAAARLALTALLRRETLAPERRVALFAELASHFKGLVEFPAELVDGLADEAYVRSVVDVLFRTSGEESAARPPVG